MFGKRPIFIFHPEDDSNRPHPDHHGPVEGNWQALTSRIRDLFTTTFTVGVDDPRHGRVRESIWQRAMSRLEDSIMLCTRCGAENFYDPGEATACWRCRRPLVTPMRLVFSNGRWVAINDVTRLWRHHLSRMPTYDFEVQMAEVVQHPERKIWGLRNLGDEPWVVEPPEGERIDVGPGRSFGLVPGTRFHFGEVDAILEA